MIESLKTAGIEVVDLDGNSMISTATLPLSMDAAALAAPEPPRNWAKQIKHAVTHQGFIPTSADPLVMIMELADKAANQALESFADCIKAKEAAARKEWEHWNDELQKLSIAHAASEEKFMGLKGFDLLRAVFKRVEELRKQVAILERQNNHLASRGERKEAHLYGVGTGAKDQLEERIFSLERTRQATADNLLRKERDLIERLNYHAEKLEDHDARIAHMGSGVGRANEQCQELGAKVGELSDAVARKIQEHARLRDRINKQDEAIRRSNSARTEFGGRVCNLEKRDKELQAELDDMKDRVAPLEARAKKASQARKRRAAKGTKEG